MTRRESDIQRASRKAVEESGEKREGQRAHPFEGTQVEVQSSRTGNLTLQPSLRRRSRHSHTPTSTMGNGVQSFSLRCIMQKVPCCRIIWDPG